MRDDPLGVVDSAGAIKGKNGARAVPVSHLWVGLNRRLTDFGTCTRRGTKEGQHGTTQSG